MATNDIIGTAGVGLILVAYFMNTFKLIAKEGAFYFLLNTTGAAIACYASWLINYVPFIILEAVWTIVSVVALMNVLRKK